MEDRFQYQYQRQQGGCTGSKNAFVFCTKTAEATVHVPYQKLRDADLQHPSCVDTNACFNVGSGYAPHLAVFMSAFV